MIGSSYLCVLRLAQSDWGIAAVVTIELVIATIRGLSYDKYCALCSNDDQGGWANMIICESRFDTVACEYVL